MTEREAVIFLSACKPLSRQLLAGQHMQRVQLTDHDWTNLTWFGRTFMAGRINERTRREAGLDMQELAALACRLGLEMSNRPQLQSTLIGWAARNDLH